METSNKMYVQPQMKVVKMQASNRLLSGSITVAGSYDHCHWLL